MKVLVVYYSLYGNTYRLARAVAGGAALVPGAEVVLGRVADFAPVAAGDRDERVRNARLLQKEIPIVRPDELAEYNAVILGAPSRCGAMCAQMKNFLDQTGVLWAKGALEGTVAGVFSCSTTPCGTSDTALLSMIIPLLHLGMIVAGIPYSVNAAVIAKSGGSPYGVLAVTGENGERPPNAADLKLAGVLGHRISWLARAPARGPYVRPAEALV